MVFETLRNLLDEDAVRTVEAQAQYTHPRRKVRSANELARVLLDLGDLVDVVDDDISLLDRAEGDAQRMLSQLVTTHRVVLVPITTVETNRDRWISTMNFPLFRAAFAIEPETDYIDKQIIKLLSERGPLPLSRIAVQGEIEKHIEKLVAGHEVLRLPKEERIQYVAAKITPPSFLVWLGLFYFPVEE